MWCGGMDSHKLSLFQQIMRTTATKDAFWVLVGSMQKLSYDSFHSNSEPQKIDQGNIFARGRTISVGDQDSIL